MKFQDPPTSAPHPSPTEDSGPSVSRDQAELQKNQDANLSAVARQIEQAKAPTDQTGTWDDDVFRASELRYRRLFEAARDGIMILEADTGKISDVNPFLVEMLGFSHSELVGSPIWELGPFKDIACNKAKFEQLQQRGYVRYDNLPLEARDGRTIAVEFVSNVYQAGNCQAIQCNVRDITVRTEAEKERLRLAAVIEYEEDAIITKTVDGIVIGWNGGAERQYGYTAEEMIGHPISVLFPSDHHKEYLQIMEKVRKGENVPAFDTVRRRKDGSLVNVSVNITPIEARDGKVTGASKSSHDIGRIKKLEAQFIEAQKMEVVGQLAAGVAHDFNNILAIIIGYGDLLIRNFDAEDPLRTYTEEILHAAERAAGLTKQLLFFSRKQTVQTVVLDLNEVVQDMNKMLRRLIDENIEMTIAAGEQIGRIKADAGYLGQLLMNLVVNARDAMAKGGILSIATANVTLSEADTFSNVKAPPGNYVKLSVRDTGIGMTEEVKAHLFEAFFTTKPKGKGTGLGLTTCQTVVQQCGGHIGVSSELGKGTVFEVYFPRIEEVLAPTVEILKKGSLPRGTETLLLVEDDPSLRFLACHVLEAQGYAVLTAANGQDGLHLAQAHQGAPISLVVTDVIMPLMSGKVMAEWLKITYPALKILFTSGYTDDAMAQNGILEAEVEFLPKPYTPGVLTRKVREMLDAPQTPISA